MRVAIIGAGLAGLACAHQLEQFGIRPDIFELRHRVGERFPNMEAIVLALHRPWRDALLELSVRYGLALAPSALLHTVELHSRRRKVVLRGQLGYLTIRGNDDRALERQLAGMVRSPINCGQDRDWRQLAASYDRVVVATGTPHVAMSLGIWTTDVEVFGKGADFTGHFRPGVVRIWFDPDLACQGYVYFTAFDQNNAYLATMAYPADPSLVDELWRRTLAALEVHPPPATPFTINSYKIGRVRSRSYENLLLVGNAGGFIDPWLGFGQIPSLLSGVLAARAIKTGADFDALTAPWSARYEQLLAIRRVMSGMTAGGFDAALTALAWPGVRWLLLDSHLDVIPWLGRACRGLGHSQA
jgi:flavin-dependent dehydrogenase